MTAIEQQITELGEWACALELSAADPSTPYWMRTQDADRAKLIREQQFILAGQSRPDPLIHCAVEGCVNHCAGSRYCARCEEELNSQPYPFANLLMHLTFLDAVISAWKKIWHD